MPVSYEIDHERRLVLVVGTGVLEDTDLLAVNDAQRADPKFDPEYSQLNDYSKADILEVTSKALQAAAARPPLFSPKSRRAFAVPTKLMVISKLRGIAIWTFVKATAMRRPFGR